MNDNNDIIIIGGGIIGIACAHYLLDKGQRVRIIEQDQIGSGASHGNCGLLHFSGVIPLCTPGVVSHEILRTLKGSSPLYIQPRVDLGLWQWLINFARACNPTRMNTAAKAKDSILKYSAALFDTLLSEDGMDCDFEKNGLLLLFKDKKYFDKYEKTNAFLKTFGFDAKRLDQKQTKTFEPAVSSDVIGSYFNSHDWHLRPEHLLETWTKRLIEKGLIIERKCKANALNIENGRIKSVSTVKGTYRADQFVLTTGTWVPEIQKSLGLKIPVQPGKGYSITMMRPQKAPQRPCLLYERNMVATPWNSGYRLGGTMEFSGFDAQLNEKRLGRLIKGANEYLETSTAETVIERWTGLRPMTHDDLPIIGRPAGLDNLTMATGHGMLGLTMATGTGKIITDLILKNKCEIDISAFSPERF